MGVEKRMEDRTKLRQLVVLRATTERVTFLAYTVDVSPHGMFVETKDLRPPGTKLSLQSAGGTVEMVVVRVRERGSASGMGLRRV